MNPRLLLRRALVVLVPLALVAGIAMLVAPRLAAGQLRRAAAQRGLALSWRSLSMQWPAGIRVSGLSGVAEGTTDTLVTAREFSGRIAPLSVFGGRPRVTSITLAGARILARATAGTDADTLAPAADAGDRVAPAVAERVRRRADALVRALLVPARNLPELHLTDVEWRRPGAGLSLTALDLTHDDGGTSLAAAGTVHGETPVPFDALARWERDDHFTARAEFRIAGAEPPSPSSVVLVFDGQVTQDRRARELRVAPGAQLRIGQLGARLTAVAAAAGPRFELAIEADSLTARQVVRSLPQPVLGPLTGLEVTGSWDWHAQVKLDLAQPDSVRFSADVIPHGLALDPALSRPSLHVISGPFRAAIHLPRQRVIVREMNALNPNYRPLDRISPYLRDALITNEDGGFWKHRGFNTEAIGLAMAANLRAGSYRRGAGTITMQLARNLWLGHERTLSRKGQEVVLAWLLEHETGIPKERLLEVYLNIIEWGPGLHGAGEAARWYFDKGADELTLDEALFLAILVPSPSKWRWRVGPDAQLRPFARAQMAFIAGKMASKGWLDPAAVPHADSLRIELRGAARAQFAAPDSAGAAADAPADSLAFD